MSHFRRIALATVSAVALVQTSPSLAASAGNWVTTGGDAGQSKYSTLSQITPANVGQLKQAWAFPAGGGQVTPLAIDGVLYYPSAQKVFAVDGDTGKQIWATDLARLIPMPADRGINPARPAQFSAGGRAGTPQEGFLSIGPAAKYGVAYWPGTGRIGPRIVVATGAGYLLQLDAKTGSLIKDFNDGKGFVDLRVGVMENVSLSDYTPGAVPTIYKNLAMITPRTAENGRYGPPGDPRAFDLLTGKLVWRFHVIPQPGEPNFGDWGLDGWQDRRGAGSWVPMSVDQASGLVFMSTGNATDQNFGGARPGDNLYATTLLALDGDTGKLRWHFQTTHHDIYDWDLNSPAVLIEVPDATGKKIPAIAQTTKNGYLFILDRLTGKPIIPVEERRQPPVDTPGELASPTQPVPVRPGPIARVSLTRDEVANLSPESHKYCLDIYDNVVQMGEGTAYGMVPTLVFPSSTGGPNNYGAAFDPAAGTLFINTQNLGTVAMLTPAVSAGFEIVSKSKLPFVDQNGYPCSKPPWGELMAINASSGDTLWRQTLGEYKELTAKGVPQTGQIPSGGSTVTATGLLFVAATQDRQFRAMDSKTGRLLWSTEMGGAGTANPVLFKGKSGKEYVAIVTAGGAPTPGVAQLGNPGQLLVFSAP